jgi:hypothetical protein
MPVVNESHGLEFFSLTINLVIFMDKLSYSNLIIYSLPESRLSVKR